MGEVGARRILIDGAQKVSGRLGFASDAPAAAMAHAALRLSDRPHARVVSVEVEAVRGMPGVIGVWWHANTPQHAYNSSDWRDGQQSVKDERMFPPVARHVGDRVAVVLAEDAESARVAAAALRVRYDDLPAVLTLAEAVSTAVSDANAGVGPFVNPLAVQHFAHGDPEAAMAVATHVVDVTVTTPRSHHCALEPHVAIASPGDDGRLCIDSPCQSVFAVQAVVAQALGMEPASIRVRKAPIGGSFGGKAEPILEPIAAFLARESGRQVRLVLSRHQTFIASRTRSATCGRMRIGLSAEGRILARQVEMAVEIGAYATGGNYFPASMLQRMVRLYDVAGERYAGRSYYTNTMPSGAFRGYGSPQIHALGEIALDLAARQGGFDPVALRLRNIVSEGARDPWQGLDLGPARGADCLTRGAAAFDWAGRRARPRGHGRFRRGVGAAAATHINGCFPGEEEETTATLALRPDGRVDLTCALHDLGCGSDTTLAQIAAHPLGLVADAIVIGAADTDTCPYDLGTRASRMTHVVGEAVRQSAERLATALRAAAAPALNTAPEAVNLVAGQARAGEIALSLAALARWLAARDASLPAATATHRPRGNPGSYAAHFAEVEVDCLTGRVRVLEYLAAHDLGRAINPMLVEGQIHGGVQIGLGYALSEDVDIDPATGRVRADSFARYGLFNAPEMPPIRVILVEEGGDAGPHGARALGEIATIPVAPAVVNAVNHALGTALTELPLIPQRITRALETSYLETT